MAENSATFFCAGVGTTRLSLHSPWGSLQNTQSKELINQLLLFRSHAPQTSLRVVGPKQKRCRISSTSPCFASFAEREGFEPPEPLSSSVFKTGAIDHSAIFPGTKVRPFFSFAKFLSKSSIFSAIFYNFVGWKVKYNFTAPKKRRTESVTDEQCKKSPSERFTK